MSGGDWLRDEDRVIGYVSGSGTAFAYPLKILNSHEIVNDVNDGVYVLVTYCLLPSVRQRAAYRQAGEASPFHDHDMGPVERVAS